MKKIQIPFSKVSASTYERVSAYENAVNTEFDWEVKTGIEKVELSAYKSHH